MSGLLIVGAGIVLLVGWYTLGAVFRVLMKDPTTPTIRSNFSWGSSALVFVGMFLALVYGLVRFVKWAWE
jgi:hypothetical protein